MRYEIVYGYCTMLSESEASLEHLMVKALPCESYCRILIKLLRGKEVLASASQSKGRRTLCLRVRKGLHDRTSSHGQPTAQPLHQTPRDMQQR